jgi:prepilin peptidase CpaA
MLEVPLLPASIVLLASLVAAVMDVWKFKVYNALTLPLLVGGLIYHAAVDGIPGLQGSLMGILFGFATLIVVYAMGGMGAGDVKLMAAVGAWLCMPLTFYVFLLAALAAGAYAALLTVMSGRLRETWIEVQIILFRLMAFGQYLGADGRLEAEMKRSDRRRRLVPFGAMLALGLVAVIAWCNYAEVRVSYAWR